MIRVISPETLTIRERDNLPDNVFLTDSNGQITITTAAPNIDPLGYVADYLRYMKSNEELSSSDYRNLSAVLEFIVTHNLSEWYYDHWDF